MFLLFAACLSREPRYNIQFSNSINQVDLDEYTIEIPGPENQALVCAVADKLRGPKSKSDPLDLLAAMDGQCGVSQTDPGILKVCFNGEVTLNGSVSLGFIDDGEVLNGSVRYVTSNGDYCTDNATWSSMIDFTCDNTAPSQGLWIVAAWEQDPCTLSVVVNTRQLCRSKLFSNEYVMDVVCVPKMLADKFRA